MCYEILAAARDLRPDTINFSVRTSSSFILSYFATSFLLMSSTIASSSSIMNPKMLYSSYVESSRPIIVAQSS
jgi:hypothetical protein